MRLIDADDIENIIVVHNKFGGLKRIDAPTIEVEPVNHGVQKVLKNDLQQCISSFERMKKGGVGIADELVYQTCKRALEYIEKLDVEPVRHGKWKHVPGMNSRCSECGQYFPVRDFESRPFDINYCPNCGAKMEGGEVCT